MSNQKYGPQTAEVEALMKQIETISLAQTNGLAKARNHGLALYRARDTSSDAARGDAWYAARSAALDDPDQNGAWGPVSQYAAQGTDLDNPARREDRGPILDRSAYTSRNAARDVVRDALLAVIARDLISTEQFDLLYGPWASIMDK
jgi:hypothetical protein